jgi:hypothetical protein
VVVQVLRHHYQVFQHFMVAVVVGTQVMQFKFPSVELVVVGLVVDMVQVIQMEFLVLVQTTAQFILVVVAVVLGVDLENHVELVDQELHL